MRTFFAGLLAGLVALPAFADETEGHILAFDRQQRIIVLTDKTVWHLPADLMVPADLRQGDRVLFEFDSLGEDGIGEILAMHRLATALDPDNDGGS